MNDLIVESLSDEISDLARVSDMPSLVALSYALRHPETWPKDFVWNYSNCRKCAIGLALRLWPGALSLPKGQKAQQTWIAREMAMSHREAGHVFFGLAPVEVTTTGWIFKRTECHIRWDSVAADDVADAIDAYLVKERGV